MKTLKLCVLVCVLGMPGLVHGQTTPGQAAVNFLNSLIYEAMTSAPTWSQAVNGASSENHRESFVRKQGSVTCTATKYSQPQSSGIQSEYHCDVAAAGVSMWGLTIMGEAAELAYSALVKMAPDLKSADEFAPLLIPEVGTLKVQTSGWVCDGKCVPKRIAVSKTQKNGTNLTVIECGLPGQVQKPLARGEFFEAEKAGAIEHSPNSYSCVVSLK